MCHDQAVVGAWRYRKDLYRGTAEYYDRFRLPYPVALIDDLRARVPVDGDSRVLDLGCGTGQIAFALTPLVGEVWAVDQEPDAVEFGRTKSARLGVGNIRWITATAEDAALDGTFDLVAIGNAFHRFDRDAVAKRLFPHVKRRGCVALLWSGTPNRGDRPWQRVLNDTLERWMDIVDARDRVPAGWQEAMDRDPSEQVLRRAGFAYEGESEFSVAHRWSLESLTGLVYSTSSLNREALGERVDDFEADLRGQLLSCCPDGVFEQDVTFACELARR